MTKPALTVILALGSALVAMPSPAADRKLPSKFWGHWCIVNSSNQSARDTYRHGRCPDSDAWISVNANGFDGHEMSCTVLSATAISKSRDYQVKFKCEGEGVIYTRNYRMSLDRGRLIIHYK